MLNPLNEMEGEIMMSNDELFKSTKKNETEELSAEETRQLVAELNKALGEAASLITTIQANVAACDGQVKLLTEKNDRNFSKIYARMVNAELLSNALYVIGLEHLGSAELSKQIDIEVAGMTGRQNSRWK